MALEDHGANLSAYFFNTQTGEVLILSEDFDRAQIEEIAEDASHRFLRIEPIDSREGYGIMENFVRTLPPLAFGTNSNGRWRVQNRIVALKTL
jgi:hypothetical protein